MDKIEKTAEELNEMEMSINGALIKEMFDKINEIIDWINTQ